jgi:hypothetical protein
MKRVMLRKNRSDEVMKCLPLLKNWSDEAFNASLLLRCQHYINPYRNRQINRAKLSKTYVNAKMTMFFGFATEITEITNFF